MLAGVQPLLLHAKEASCWAGLESGPAGVAQVKARRCSASGPIRVACLRTFGSWVRVRDVRSCSSVVFRFAMMISHQWRCGESVREEPRLSQAAEWVNQPPVTFQPREKQLTHSPSGRARQVSRERASWCRDFFGTPPKLRYIDLYPGLHTPVLSMGKGAPGGAL